MNQKDKRELENELIACGLSKLDDPNFLDLFAGMVDQFPGDKHWFLQGLLNECDPAQRYEMYNALTPRIRSFKPMPLSTYEAKIAEEAGRMISQGRMRVEGPKPHAIEVGADKFAVVPRSEATGAVATVRCHRCPKIDNFHAETAAGAMLEARKAGWVREKGVNKETCPKCAVASASQEVVALSRTEKLFVNDQRRVN